MTLSATRLKERARRRHASNVRRRRDPRYVRVLGRFVAAGLLSTSEAVPQHTEPISVAEALWAGELEPRILELLPALLVKTPAFFSDATALPEDLAYVVQVLRKSQDPQDFRGIPGRDVARWVPRIGRKNKLPSRLKSFRFTSDDTRLLARLSQELDTTETDVLRRGMRELASKWLEVNATARASARRSRS